MRNQRLFEIVYLLLEKERTAGELAEHFEVSPRTIYRDIDLLGQAGIPVVTWQGKGGGIRLMERFVLDKSAVSEQEQTQILAALQSLDAVGVSEAGQTLSKLRGLFRQEEAYWIEADFSTWNQKKGQDWFALLKQVVLEKKVIQICYGNSRGNPSQRMVEPLKLVFKGQAWYLYGYCRLKQGERFFKLSRIRSLRVMDESFTRTVPERVVFPPEKNALLVSVTCRAVPALSYRIDDEQIQWRKTPEGDLLFTMELPAGEWIYGYLMSYGEGLEVLKPEEVRQEMRRRIHAMEEKYKT